MADAYVFPPLDVPRRAPLQFGRAASLALPEAADTESAPSLAEELAALPAFEHGHPFAPPERLAGALSLIHRLEGMFCTLTGLDECSTTTAAGLPSETAGLLMIRGFHESHNSSRRLVLVPSAELAAKAPSCGMAGYEAVPLKVGDGGILEPDAVEDAIRRYGREIACLFFSTPNTRGLFESHIVEIADTLHGIGAQVFLDGARLSRLVGIALPRDMGVDVLSWPLQGTFTDERAGDGPDAAALLARSHLAQFLPGPREGFGNFGAQLRALVFILRHGGDGLKRLAMASLDKEHFANDRTKTALGEMVVRSQTDLSVRDRD